jgi:unsaturated rhamnogalacturonyl hydrolase
MKIILSRHSCATAIFFVAIFQSHAQATFSDITPQNVLAIMQRAADWQLVHPCQHAKTDWTQGAGDVGMMALAGISGDAKYRDAMLAMGETNQWELGTRTYHADDQCVGQTYAELYLHYRDPKMIAPLRERFDFILSHPSGTTNLDFTQPHGKAQELWSWCDSLFMAPPTWLRLYAATDDERYLNFAVTNFWHTTDFLYDTNEHLFFRDSTYFNRREANGQKVFWSRGNGWVMAGLVRTLQYLPMNNPDRPRFEQLFKDMAERILRCQQPDGLWRSSLLDPESYPLKETSGSGFYTYALAWGVSQNLLDRAKFEPPVRKGWMALVGCVDADGKLTHVQPIGADPKKFADDSTEAYGTGAFLLAGSEVYRMAVLENANATLFEKRAIGVKVTNPANFRRDCETVEIPTKEFARGGYSFLDALRDSAKQIAVMDSVSPRILDSQLESLDLTPQNASKNIAEKLLFQVDLAPGETRTFYILDAAALAAVPPPIVKTFVRQVPERFNDLAWESDRTAHRIYHQDLINGEGMVSSGIDVWSKRTRNLVVNERYKNGDYHNDHGDGMDDYEVSSSRGDGGLGVWHKGTLYVSSNYRNARIITTGPIRSEFEVNYDAWDAAGQTIAETKRISIDAGSNMNRAESIFSSDDKSPLEIGVGIAERPRNGGTNGANTDLSGDGSGGQITQDQTAGWETYWQPTDRDRGNIAIAIILPAGIKELVTEKSSLPTPSAARLAKPGSEGMPPIANRLAITSAKIGKPFVYYFGAGWSKSGDFPNPESWNKYVAHFVERLKSPLQVTIGN